MNSKLYLTIPVALTLALGACNTTTGPITGTPVTLNYGTLPDDLSFAYDSGAQTLTLTVGGVAQAPMTHVATSNGISEFRDLAVSSNAARGGTSAGSFVVISSPISQLGLAGTQLTRIGDTTLPTAGNATFSGSYIGFLLFSPALTYYFPLSGDADLTADFSAGTIGGEITNRLLGGSLNNDLILHPTAITSNAEFSGSTTGGEIAGSPNHTTTDGTYFGLFVGADGGELVGGVRLNHNLNGNDLIEIGGFAATN